MISTGIYTSVDFSYPVMHISVTKPVQLFLTGMGCGWWMQSRRCTNIHTDSSTDKNTARHL